MPGVSAGGSGMSKAQAPALRLGAAVLAAFLAEPGWTQQPASGDPGSQGSSPNGQRIFETRCVACHSVDAHRVGPALGTIFGRPAGRSPDYVYSVALRRANHRWDREKLLVWLANPEDLVPGQAMGYRLEQEKDRRDVVAYLASLSAQP